MDPFFTASWAYSTWKRCPSGEKTVIARSYRDAMAQAYADSCGVDDATTGETCERAAPLPRATRKCLPGLKVPPGSVWARTSCRHGLALASGGQVPLRSPPAGLPGHGCACELAEFLCYPRCLVQASQFSQHAVAPAVVSDHSSYKDDSKD